MALILQYRVEPHPGINNEIYAALSKQVGKVGIQIQLSIGPDDDPESTQVLVQGKFIGVEGEHARLDFNPMGLNPREPES